MVEIDMEKKMPDGSFVLDNNAKRARYYNPTSEVSRHHGRFPGRSDSGYCLPARRIQSSSLKNGNGDEQTKASK
jgi:hypothetical protein